MRPSIARPNQASVVECAKSALSFSWAMSIFSAQQMANLFSPQAAKAFNAVTQGVEAELGDALQVAFRAGDQWQKAVVDRVLGAAPPTGQSGKDPAVSAEYPFAPHYLEVLGSRMHYVEQGTGEPILLLHGNPTWSYIWRNIIPHLSPLGRCIAPDLIGYGRSDKPDIEYRFKDHERYLEGFIEAMGLRNVTLVLHDQGSSLGFHYAMRHEDNVAAIAFFEAIVRPYPWEHFSTPEFREIFRRFRSGGVGGEGWQLIVEQNMFIEQLLPLAAGRPLSEREMSFYREPFPTPASRIPIWRFPRETAIGGEPVDVWQAVTSYSERLRSSRLPKLMLYASPGALLTAEHVAWCKQNLTNLVSVDIGPGSHFVQESSPHRIGREIAAWYRRLQGQRAGPIRPSGIDSAAAQAVQDLVDRAAHFNLFSVPEPGPAGAALRSPDRSNAVVGFKIDEVLHRFRAVGRAPSSRSPLAARTEIGEAVAKLAHRWMLVPPAFVSSPGREPPPTPLDPSRSQRFVMLDGRCTFASGRDGFRTFGTGLTFPTRVNGQPRLLATAVGVLMDGFGQFRGHGEGTFVYCGTLTPELGFRGNLLLRLMDLHGTFRTDSLRPVQRAGLDPDPETSYLVFRGQAEPSDPVVPRTGADGRQIGLTVHQGLRLLDLDSWAGTAAELHSTARIGPWIGRVTAEVTFDPQAAEGSIYDPVPFTSIDEFTFFDGESGEQVGGLTADSCEGRVFNARLGGRPGIRFGGIGRILSGTGCFSGVEGLMTDNSVVVFSPHVSASVYVLRIHDPEKRFRVT